MAIHRGLTADQRRELRRHQLIQAALDAIAEDGVRNLRVRAISGRARLNDRYFYESFRDCQELLLAAFDDQFTLALSGIMATLSDAPLELEARARTILEFAFGFLDEDPRRQRLLVELQTAEALAPRRQEVTDVLTRIMVGQIRQLLGERAGTDDTVTLTALTVSSGLLSWLHSGIESRSRSADLSSSSSRPRSWSRHRTSPVRSSVRSPRRSPAMPTATGDSTSASPPARQCSELITGSGHSEAV